MDGVAAVVGPQIILVSEVMAGANQARASGAPVTSARDLAKLEKDILDQLIEAELLVQKAKDEKVEVSEVDLQRQVDETEKRARDNFKSEAEFRQALKEAGFGALDEWRKLQGDQLRRQQLQRDVVQKLRRDGKMTAVNVSER
jgi:peptidyl-prolyl cis-trans isomerase SurA